MKWDSVVDGVKKIQDRETEHKKYLAQGMSYLDAARQLGVKQL